MRTSNQLYLLASISIAFASATTICTFSGTDSQQRSIGSGDLCTGTYSQTELILWSDKGITGTLPTQLALLTQLTSVAISQQGISGTLPTQLANLKNVKYSFDFSRQSISGTIPHEFGNLTNAWVYNGGIKLHENKISGTIPPEIGAATNLAALHLAKNRISGTIPPQIGKIAGLSYCGLLLTGNSISGTVPSEIGQLSNLKQLSFNDNRLSGTLPSTMVPSLNGLTYCNLGGTNVFACPIPSGLDSNCLGAGAPAVTCTWVPPAPPRAPPPVPSLPPPNGALIQLTGTAPKITFGDPGEPTCELVLNRLHARLESTCSISDGTNGRRLEASDVMSEIEVLKAQVADLQNAMKELMASSNIKS